MNFFRVFVFISLLVFSTNLFADIDFQKQNKKNKSNSGYRSTGELDSLSIDTKTEVFNYQDKLKSLTTGLFLEFILPGAGHIYANNNFIYYTLPAIAVQTSSLGLMIFGLTEKKTNLKNGHYTKSYTKGGLIALVAGATVFIISKAISMAFVYSTIEKHNKILVDKYSYFSFPTIDFRVDDNNVNSYYIGINLPFSF